MKRTLIIIVVIGFAVFGLIAFIGYVVGDKAEPFCEIELESNAKDLLLKVTTVEPKGTHLAQVFPSARTWFEC